MVGPALFYVNVQVFGICSICIQMAVYFLKCDLAYMRFGLKGLWEDRTKLPMMQPIREPDTYCLAATPVPAIWLTSRGYFEIPVSLTTIAQVTVTSRLPQQT